MPSLSAYAAQFVDQAVALQDVDAAGARSLGYTARILTIATLPHSAQPGDVYERRNGGYRLVVQALPGVGLPCGSYPRLLLAWLSTEIVRTQQRDIELGPSMAQFLRSLGLQRSGGRARSARADENRARSAGAIWRLRRQMVSLFGARFVLHSVSQTAEAFELMPVGDSVQLWQTSDSEAFPSVLRVSEPFFEHVCRAPVPIDLRAIRALKRSPLALDIYTWLTHRNFVLQSSGKASVVVAWSALQRQFGANYPQDSRGRADFKRAFHTAYRRVHLVYPAARLRDEGDVLVILASAPHVRVRPTAR